MPSEPLYDGFATEREIMRTVAITATAEMAVASANSH